MVLLVYLERAFIIDARHLMIVDESFEQDGRFTVHLLQLYELYDLNDLLQSFFPLLKLGNWSEQRLHVGISSGGQDKCNNNRNAHQIYEEEHIEKEGPNECSQKNKVIGPSKNSMQNCY
jgi:hypothetical protein